MWSRDRTPFILLPEDPSQVLPSPGNLASRFRPFSAGLLVGGTPGWWLLSLLFVTIASATLSVHCQSTGDAAQLAPRVEILSSIADQPGVEAVRDAFFLRTDRRWTWESRVRNERFGSQVTGVGDLDGDGKRELLIGVPGHYRENQMIGMVMRLQLGTQTHYEPRSYTFGNSARANWGQTFDFNGDWNGDKRSDLLVFCPAFEMDSARAGSISVVTNPAGVAFSERKPTYVGRTKDVFSLGSVAFLKDLNGDGCDEVLVGYPLASSKLERGGHCEILLGGVSNLGKPPIWGFSGESLRNELGSAVSAVGDLNGDGLQDIAIGAPSFPSHETRKGRVYIFLRGTNGFGTEPSQVLNGTREQDKFGSRIFPLGDVNGDGRMDLGLGAVGWEATPLNAGAAYVFLGSPTGVQTNPVWAQRSSGKNARLGSAIANVGDVNEDGYPDLAISAPRWGGSDTNQGYVAVFQGTRTGFGTVPSWVAIGGHLASSIGTSVAGVGDMNGDGIDDFAIGSSGFSKTQHRGGRVDVIFGSKELFRPVGVSTPIPDLQLIKRSPQKVAASVAGASNSVGRSNELSRASTKSPPAEGKATLAPWNVKTILLSVGGVLSLLWVVGVWVRRQTALKERAKLARDLHDGVGGVLHRLAQSAESNPEMAANLSEASAALNEAIWQRKGGSSLEEFVSFVGEQAHQIFKRTGTSLNLNLPLQLPDRQLPEHRRQNLAMMVREALGNVVKHAEAKKVDVAIAVLGNQLEIVIVDDGCGLTEPKADGTLAVPTRTIGGNGLRNLAERAKEMGGTCVVSPGPDGRGTQVRIVSPC